MASVAKVLKITEEFLSLPAAPFREAAPLEYIKQFCDARGISWKQDEMGNLIATYGKQYKNHPWAFAAHTDHPGFIIEKPGRSNTADALFYGGVELEYFEGSKVKIFTAEGPIRAKVISARADKKNNRKKVKLQTSGPVARGDLGMWDLPHYSVKGDRLSSRSCDDSVGAAAVLALLDSLVRRKVQQKVLAVFTIAEEAGLQGAKYICANRKLPKNARLIAIETSSERADAKIGDGVVIRVGDALSIFSPEMTAFMTDTARQLKRRKKNFRYQRKLMDGGCCESTIYQMFGYTNGAICIPLGNYHNRDTRRKKIAAEFVSVSDLVAMVDLFEAVISNSDKAQKFLKPAVPQFDVEHRPLGETVLKFKKDD